MLGFFTDPYPGELFYSACARFKATVGYTNNVEVARILFGKKSISAVAILPCYLGYFVDQLPPRRQYTPDSLIAKNTLFPFYRPFLSTAQAQKIHKQMITGPSNNINYRFRMIHGGVVHPTVLRYCPECVAVERSTLDECYWHCLHQVPGMVLCPRHEVFLEDSEISTSTFFRSNAFLPAEDSIPLQVVPRQAKTSPYFHVFKQLARDIVELMTMVPPDIEQEFWDRQYTRLMGQHGYVTREGRFCWSEFLQAFLQHYPLELLHQLGCHIQLEEAYWNHWWAALRGALNSRQHPLFHLLTLQLLGIGISSFFQEQYTPLSAFSDGLWPCLNPACKHYHQRVIATCQVLKRNFSTKPAMARFACTCGFIYSRPEQVRDPEDQYKYSSVFAYGEVWQNKLRDLWGDSSISLNEIKRRLKASLGSIYGQAKRLGLQVPRPSKFQTSRYGVPRQGLDQQISESRQRWLALWQAHPEATYTELRQKLPNDAKRLRMYDQEWLKNHWPLSSKRRQKQRGLLIEADEVIPRTGQSGPSDAALATSVRTIAQQLLASAERPVRISKRRLQLAIPALLVLRSAKDKFPLTAQAVEECRETGESAGLRRIRWTAQCYLEEQVCPARTLFEERAGIIGQRMSPKIRQAVDEALRVLAASKEHKLALVEARG